MRIAPAFLASALALAAALDARACGVCVEDKVAVAYDHAVVSHALARRHVVVFAEVVSAGDPRVVARARDAAMRVRGIDRASVRSAPSPATLSFALDPAIHSPAAALAAVEKAARHAGVTLKLLKVLK